jgi:hypothetical protein
MIKHIPIQKGGIIKKESLKTSKKTLKSLWIISSIVIQPGMTKFDSNYRYMFTKVRNMSMKNDHST